MTINIESGLGGGSLDDDDTTTEAMTPQSVLDGLRASLQAKVVIPPLDLPVPGRPNISVTFDLDIDANMIGLWQKRAKDPSLPDKIDVRKIATIVIADRARAIKWDGKTVIDPDSGKALTFTDKGIQDMLGAMTPLSAVKQMYVLDAAIIRTMKRILDDAGYGDDVDWDNMEDPTQTSSMS